MDDVNGSKMGINGINYNNSIHFSKKSESSEPVNNEENKPQLTDFSNDKAESLGRSMVIKEKDNIDSDLKAIIENPQIVENSDKMFNIAYDIAKENGSKTPYEDAARFSTGLN